MNLGFWTIKDFNYITYEKILLNREFTLKDCLRYIRRYYRVDKKTPFTINYKRKLIIIGVPRK